MDLCIELAYLYILYDCQLGVCIVMWFTHENLNRCLHATATSESRTTIVYAWTTTVWKSRDIGKEVCNDFIILLHKNLEIEQALLRPRKNDRLEVMRIYCIPPIPGYGAGKFTQKYMPRKDMQIWSIYTIYTKLQLFLLDSL